MKTECPKCGSKNAWIEAGSIDVVLRCYCGVHKVLQTKLLQMEIQQNDCEDDVKLPKRDTHLWVTLQALSVMVSANSAVITQTLVDMGKEFNVSDVSSYLTILRSKGLVRTTESRRGIPGGSTWELTDASIRLLGVV